jgi:hypothetical protein
MTNFSSCLMGCGIPTVSFVGFVLVIILFSSSSSSFETPSHLSYSNAFLQEAIAQQQQQLSAKSAPINKNVDSQNKSGNTIEASGHFANNQIKDGVVTWIQGGYWNLQIINMSNNGDNDNQISNSNSNSSGGNNNTATFLANFTMIKPDGSLSHNHIINNFSSDNVVLSHNDIVVTGVADIVSDDELEYKEVPLIVHLMGKKVLGLTIDVSKTEGHFASPNEMFGTLISGVGVNSSNSTTTTVMNHEEPSMLNESPNKTSMTMMNH